MCYGGKLNSSETESAIDLKLGGPLRIVLPQISSLSPGPCVSPEGRSSRPHLACKSVGNGQKWNFSKTVRALDLKLGGRQRLVPPERSRPSVGPYQSPERRYSRLTTLPLSNADVECHEK